MRGRVWRWVVCVALLAAGCTSSAPSTQNVVVPATTTSTSTTVPPVTTTTAAPVPLVPWTGPVEHLFFHTLVIRPELAFQHDQLGQGFRDYFVTVGEFRAILEQLYANGWTLVDIHRAI